ncbi:MAG: hypothetical protein NZ765_12895 [Anaerolineae bacterium]|nr:hypothetical protein [Anaerolineae bacterium]MDW8072405.1 hypothetical protein [Anaerolineae bacterium]
MRDNPERLAWIILILAFITFCALVIGIPLGVRAYILNATQAERSSVTAVQGTVLVQRLDASTPFPVSDGTTIQVEENTNIRTDDNAQAIVTFFNDSLLTLYHNTSVTIRQARSPRFASGQQPDTILVELHYGRVRVVPMTRTMSESARTLHFALRCRDVEVVLSEGSYALEASEEEMQITTRAGLARVIIGEEQRVLAAGERAILPRNQPPIGPVPAERNLLVNGDFSQPLEGSWQVYRVEPPSGVVTTTARIESIGVQHALHFQSSGQDNVHSEIGVIQHIGKNIQDFASLRILLDVRVNLQSLPGGGTLGSEFPLMVHLAYDEMDGTDRDWYCGFYYAPAPSDWILYDTPFNTSRRILRSVWYPFESPNLLDSLSTAKPVYLKFIRLYGSGWLYDAYVTNVTLLVQE